MARQVRKKKTSGRGSTDRQGPRKVSARRLPARTSSVREEKRGVDLVRLNKYLADQGVASRRASDELIAAGKVTVDGMPVTELGTKVDPIAQKVEVDGFILRPEGTARRYYLLNKPSGVVCTNERRETRPRAIDLITDRQAGRIYTVVYAVCGLQFDVTFRKRWLLPLPLRAVISDRSRPGVSGDKGGSEPARSR